MQLKVILLKYEKYGTLSFIYIFIDLENNSTYALLTAAQIFSIKQTNKNNSLKPGGHRDWNQDFGIWHWFWYWVEDQNFRVTRRPSTIELSTAFTSNYFSKISHFLLNFCCCFVRRVTNVYFFDVWLFYLV